MLSDRLEVGIADDHAQGSCVEHDAIAATNPADQRRVDKLLVQLRECVFWQAQEHASELVPVFGDFGILGPVEQQHASGWSKLGASPTEERLADPRSVPRRWTCEGRDGR